MMFSMTEKELAWLVANWPLLAIVLMWIALVVIIVKWPKKPQE